MFFLATYALAWACWFAAAALLQRPLSGGPGVVLFGNALLFLGVFAPALVGLALTARAEGKPGVLALGGRILRPVRGYWYVFAVGYMAVIKLTAALAHRVIAGTWPRFGDEAWYIMAAAILFSMWVQVGEELGWRGYALPRLATRFGLPRASVLLGVVWACWHLPLFFFVKAGDTFGQSFPLFLVEVTAMSVALAFLFWRTKGALLPVMVLHAAVNDTKDIVPSTVPGATNALALSTSLVAWLSTALLWLAAAYFLFAMRRADAADLA